MVSPELPRCCLTSGSKIRENGCLRAIVTIIMGPPAAASTSRPCPAWRTATPRTRPSDTLRRYAAAVGKRLVLSAEDIQHTRPRVTTPNADRRRGQESSGQEEAKGVNQGPLLEVGKG